ncbi:hypothetical protein VTO73DRAFT_15517 [Trametes versicolor]
MAATIISALIGQPASSLLDDSVDLPRIRNALEGLVVLDIVYDPWTSPLFTPPEAPGAKIYLRTDSVSRRSEEGDIGWVILVVCGESDVVTLLLPALRVDQLDEGVYEAWIELINSSEFVSCGVTDSQHATLLKIALAYRAFSRRHVGVDPTDFDIFARRLAAIARMLGPYDRADHDLVDVLSYVELMLPKDVFEGVLSPSADVGDQSRFDDGLSTVGDVSPIPPAASTPESDSAYGSDDGSIPSLVTYHSGSDYE